LIITFLGTGTSQGVPVIGCDCRVCKSVNPKDNRLRTSVHLNVNDTSLVVDTGPDFRQQMLREQIRRLDAILFTHQHKDHVAGMDDVRSFYFRQRKEIPVYANAATIQQLKNEFGYVFNPGDYKGIPKLKIIEIHDMEFEIAKISIRPFEVSHYKSKVLGFRIGDFTYITDANKIGVKAAKIIEGSKVLVINALQKEQHPSHFTLAQALAEIKRFNPEKAYLTHISHRMGLHDEVSEELPENIFLAWDGLKLSI
jgi:phosphoribosyl 1,2-cyclic phosphate phosphodiesterase